MQKGKKEASGESTELSRDDDFELAMLEAHKELTGDTSASSKAATDEEQEEEEESSEQSDDAGASADADDSDEAAGAVEATDSEDPLPVGWRSEKSAAWKKLPKDVRDYIKEREKDRDSLTSRKSTEFDRAKQSVDGVFRAAQPFIEPWGLKGITLEQGVTRALAFYEHMQKADKLELARRFLKASGKTVKDLEQSTPSPLQERLDRLEQEVEHGRNKEAEQLRTQKTDRLAAERTILATAYNEFATEKNSFGVEKYPSCKNPTFAKALGSLVIELTRQIPGTPLPQLIRNGYAELGGQILNGTPQPRSPNQTAKQKTAIASGHSKGKGSTSKQGSFDSTDDAWAATFQEFGLTE